jgi:hypothetical protein
MLRFWKRLWKNFCFKIMKKVEQISQDKVVMGFDEKKSSKEIEIILNETFNVIDKKHSEFNIRIEEKEITLLIKNITYLGNPHPMYAKRIQLSNGWQEKLQNANTFIIGIYNFKGTRLYVYFDKKNYVNRELNNSSAHVWANDLLKGFQDGIFQKIDIRKNEIFIVREDRFYEFVKDKLVNAKNIQTPEFEFFEKLKNDLNSSWKGTDCYNEMIEEDYPSKYQAEWAGFYFEYRFELFLQKNPKYTSICKFNKEKKTGLIDLDIKFEKGFYGDLKTHSIKTSGILGNDAKTIFGSIENHGKVWYIVLNHSTVKDSDKGFVTTEYWNKVQGKENLRSYSTKMKYSVKLENLQILEMNAFNKDHLSIFNQGINSNGSLRKVKIKINKKEIKRFLIYESEI